MRRFNVYEVPAGESTWPYHFEYGAEEWAIVLEGRPTLRHPDGEDELAPGDVVCFPDGPDWRPQAHEPHERDGAADDPLDRRPARYWQGEA